MGVHVREGTGGHRQTCRGTHPTCTRDFSQTGCEIARRFGGPSTPEKCTRTGKRNEPACVCGTVTHTHAGRLRIGVGPLRIESVSGPASVPVAGRVSVCCIAVPTNSAPKTLHFRSLSATRIPLFRRAPGPICSVVSRVRSARVAVKARRPATACGDGVRPHAESISEPPLTRAPHG